MRPSAGRILTTHTGSLPKPDSLISKLEARDRGEQVPEDDLGAEIREAVHQVVLSQLGAGVDLVNDGEMSKVSYATYVKERLTGFGGEGRTPRSPEFVEFSEFFQRTIGGGLGVSLPSCNAEVSYAHLDGVQTDIANLKAALEGREHEGGFLTAASPGCIAVHLDNDWYPSDEEYVFALADAMKTEYDEIHRAGLILQLDCPDLAMGRHLPYSDLTIDEFRRRAEMHVRALNHAVRDIPAEAMRMHLCWGNYEGPHIYDVPLGEIIDVVFRAKPAAVAFEAANPRHAHEWTVFREVAVPDEKVLVPGVIDTTTNFVEHPQLIAERLLHFTEAVGRDRVIAGTDCGFATFTRFQWIDPKITWGKLQAMAEGAEWAWKLS
jgi:5-methyltetrahydropteroyltriglutamate--homocysteine methyltransferase